MKNFVLDMTYKDATIINSNDDIITISSSNLPCTNIDHHGVNLDTNNISYNNNYNKNTKFNTYNLIDYL